MCGGEKAKQARGFKLRFVYISCTSHHPHRSNLAYPKASQSRDYLKLILHERYIHPKMLTFALRQLPSSTTTGLCVFQRTDSTRYSMISRRITCLQTPMQWKGSMHAAGMESPVAVCTSGPNSNLMIGTSSNQNAIVEASTYFFYTFYPDIILNCSAFFQ